MKKDNIHLHIKSLVNEVWKDNSKYDENYYNIISILKKELKKCPDDIIVLTNLGAAYCDTAKYKEAEEHLRKAITLGSNDRNTYFNLGVAVINSASQEDAKKYFKKSHAFLKNELTYEAYIDFQAH